MKEQTKKWLAIKFGRRIWPGKQLVGPTMAILAVTYRCNSGCRMCNLKARAGQKELTTNMWKEVIRQLEEMKTAGVGFTGGEPLLRPDIFELIKFARGKRMATTLNTNALLLTDKMVQKLFDAAPDNINVSLDGVTGKTYDWIRGVPGGFEKLKDNLQRLMKERERRKSRTRVTIVTCVSHLNVCDLDKIANLGADLRVDKIGFIPMHSLPETKARSGKKTRPLICKDKPGVGKLFLEQVDKIKKTGRIEVDNSSEYLAMFPIAFAGKELPISCLAGETSMTIDPYGNLFGCWPFLELETLGLGLGKDEQLRDLWFGEEYEKIRQRLGKCRACFWNCHAELSVFY